MVSYSGCSVLCEDELQAVAVKSQLQQLARPMYSNPPVHGALVVSIILGDPELKSLWLKEVKVIEELHLFLISLYLSNFSFMCVITYLLYHQNCCLFSLLRTLRNFVITTSSSSSFQGMADRIIGMRKALRENLEKLGSPLSWEHITNQVKFIFSF